MSSLYLDSVCLDTGGLNVNAVITRLRRVCVLLKTILESDRSRYLEARTWLLNSIASQSPPPEVRVACWEPLLAAPLEQSPLTSSQQLYPHPGTRDPNREGANERGSGRAAAVGSVPRSLELLTQLLMLVSEVWPDRVASLLLDRPQMFVDFFQGPGSSRRILMWFSHFSMDGMRAFKYGSHALAHYALAHREEVWDLLQWEGKHPQAPVAVAAKTHYFCELALLSTVRSLLKHHPQFWASEQWRECCRDGAVLELDRRHFCEVLLSDLCGDAESEVRSGLHQPESGSARLVALLRDFLATSKPSDTAPSHVHPYWQLLCQRLLHQLDESQLLRLVNTLAAGQPLQIQPAANTTASFDSVTISAATRGDTAGGSGPLPALVCAYAGVCGGGGWQDLSGLVLGGGAEWGSVAEAVLAHALAVARGPMQRLLAEDREELVGRLEETEQLAIELHGAPGCEGQGAAGAEGCSAAAHKLLLFGGQINVGGPGRRCAEDRLLLLSELWTLREALIRAEKIGAQGSTLKSAPEQAAPVTVAAASATTKPLETLPATDVTRGVVEPDHSRLVKNAERCKDGKFSGGGHSPDRLPLECVMAELRGITFERLHGAQAGDGDGRGDDGQRGHTDTGQAAPAAVATTEQSLVLAGLLPGLDRTTLAAERRPPANNNTAVVAGQYELLPSEDDEDEARGSRKHRSRRRDRSRDRAPLKSRKSRKRKRDDSKEAWRIRRKSKHTRKRCHGNRKGSGSPKPSRSRSKSRSRGSDSCEERLLREVKKRRWEHRKTKRRAARRKSTSSSSSDYRDSDSSSSTSAVTASSSSDREVDRRRRHKERCGSSGAGDGDSAHKHDSWHQRRSSSGLRDSRRSSTLRTSDAQRRMDSEELEGLDPLVLFHGAGVGAWRAHSNGDNVIWRVWLRGGCCGEDGRAQADVEVVGTCDDVADLLAATACKHWIGNMLRDGSGFGRQRFPASVADRDLGRGQIGRGHVLMDSPLRQRAHR